MENSAGVSRKIQDAFGATPHPLGSVPSAIFWIWTLKDNAVS